MKDNIIEIIKGYNEEKKFLEECWYAGGQETRKIARERIKEIDDLLVELAKS